MKLRKYQPSDCQYLAVLFYQTVHSINLKDYIQAQLNAWATGDVDLVAWNQSFLDNQTIVAVLDDEIVGFGDIDKSGYLNRLFVHKDHQHKGIASKICDALESLASDITITTHASITAKGFFEQRGYRVSGEQVVIREGVSLATFIMHKTVNE